MAPASLAQCLATCGKGVRHRQVTCLSGTDEKLGDRVCDASAKPPAVGNCELPECASWNVGVWGEVRPAHTQRKTETVCACVCACKDTHIMGAIAKVQATLYIYIYILRPPTCTMRSSVFAELDYIGR